jgi:integrase/recombinase XerD
MAVKRKRNAPYRKPPVAIEHTAFYGYWLRYREALLVNHYSPRTVQRRDSSLRRFAHWCEERGLERPQDITKPILERYQKHLYYYRKANGQPLSLGARNNQLEDLKQFFRWLTRENYLLYNPASELVMARSTPRLPMVLSVAEVERLLAQPALDTPLGLRDRALLEVLYSTGIRRLELCQLQQQDVNLSRQTLFVRQGKGGRDRLLPLGARAADWVAQYQQRVRPRLLLDLHEPTLFLNDYGEAFAANKLGDRVKRYLNQAGIHAPGACHLLRHAMATHMLENGADSRFIQAMLGHQQLNTTQLYTQVSIRRLQEIHAATHPAQTVDE